MPATSAVKVGRTATGVSVRVEGRGTLREGPAVHEFAVRTLDSDPCTLTMDLSACDYLDSTFLGGLVDLYKRFGSHQAPRFAVVAPPEVARRLLSPTRLDGLVRVADGAPEVLGEFVEFLASAPGLYDLGRHVMECHRRLAEVDGPRQASFQRIADQIERELANSPPDRG